MKKKDLKFKKNYFSRGSLLLEAFLAIVIISIALSVILSISAFAVKNSTAVKQSIEANFLLKESFETVRNFRDGTVWNVNGLGTVNVGESNPYYFVLNTNVTPNTWVLTSGTENIGIFTRKIIFEKVSRNPITKNIENVYNISNDDPNTRKVTVRINWLSKNMTAFTYFTNWK